MLEIDHDPMQIDVSANPSFIKGGFRIDGAPAAGAKLHDLHHSVKLRGGARPGVRTEVVTVQTIRCGKCQQLLFWLKRSSCYLQGYWIIL